MNKTKSILVAVSTMLAMAFTVSCSSDDDDDKEGGGSEKVCFYQLPEQQGESGSLCMRANVPIPKDGCGNGKSQESCPSNPSETCPMNLKGHDVEILLYGHATGSSCDDWEKMFDR